MTKKLNTDCVEYICRKMTHDPEDVRRAKMRNEDPNILTGEEGIFALFRIMSIPLEEDYFDNFFLSRGD